MYKKQEAIYHGPTRTQNAHSCQVNSAFSYFVCLKLTLVIQCLHKMKVSTNLLDTFSFAYGYGA